MDIIFDKIRLRGPEHVQAFEEWVREVDYASCRELPSVLRFQMVRAAPGADCDYFEIVHVRSIAAFEADMRTPTFQGLVQAFTQLAEVTASFSGSLLPPGFERDG